MGSYNIGFGGTRFNHSRTGYYEEIDFIKAIAIISVIILHTLSHSQLYDIYTPFHIWHAVPIFLMIAGMNSTLSATKQGDSVFHSQYSTLKLKKSFEKIILPFLIVWVFEILILVIFRKTPVTTREIIFSFFSGGIGPGGYFTPLYLQHLLFFPIILWIRNRLTSHSQYVILMGFFLVSVFFEWLCIIIDMPGWLYRLLYVRYFFAAVIGSHIITQDKQKVGYPFTGLISNYNSLES